MSQTEQEVLTGLLTILNSSSSRKRSAFQRDWTAATKRQKLTADLVANVVDESNVACDNDNYRRHFGLDTDLTTLECTTHSTWFRSKIGPMQVTRRDSSDNRKFNSISDVLSAYYDLAHPHVTLNDRPHIRQDVVEHLWRHLVLTRNQILATNASLSKNPSLPNIQDQGFTRPKVLLIIPYRNSAVAWVSHLSVASSSPAAFWDKLPRLRTEFTLPEGTKDKLVSESNKYPLDHVENMKGNIDDEFRIGVAWKGKGKWKLWSEFYKSDLIIASPLGLRKSIEKDGDADFLSSIEIVIVDQIEALLMQNWGHLQFIFDRLNLLPKDGRQTDFSRVKPWYLDGKSRLLRQTILLSAFPSPEMNALMRSCQNLAGLVDIVPVPSGIAPLQQVRIGVKHMWHRVEGTGSKDEEEDSRFDYFCQKILNGATLRQESQMLIYIPSSFDFERVKNHLKELNANDVAYLSEESSNSEISRARQQFFHSKVKLLIMTERFHYFRRYRIRGNFDVVFYGPPSFPHFYPEIISFPLETSNNMDVTCQLIFSEWDAMKMKEITGDKSIFETIFDESESIFTFI